MKLNSFNLPFLFLALERLCGINFFIHVLDKYCLGEKQEKKAQLKQKKKDVNVSECHGKLCVIVIAEVNIQIAKSVSSLASKCSCNSSFTAVFRAYLMWCFQLLLAWLNF